MAKKAVKKTFSVSFNMTNARFTIDVAADTLEEAVSKGRELGLGKALQEFQKKANAYWDDFEGGLSAVSESS